MMKLKLRNVSNVQNGMNALEMQFEHNRNEYYIP